MGLLDDAIREHLDLKRRSGADPGEVERLEREALGPVRREPLAGERPAVEAEPPPPVRNDHLDEPNEDFEHGRSELGGDPGSTALDQLPVDEHDFEAPVAAAPVDRAEPTFTAEPAYAPEPAASESADEGSSAKKGRRGFLRRTPKDDEQSKPEVPFGDHDDDFYYDDSPEHVADAIDAPPPPAAVPTPLSASPPPAADVELHDEHEYEDAPAGSLPEMPPRLPVETGRSAPPPIEAEPGATVEYDVESTFKDEDVLEETPEFLQDTPDHDRLWFEQKPPRDFDFE